MLEIRNKNRTRRLQEREMRNEKLVRGTLLSVLCLTFSRVQLQGIYRLQRFGEHETRGHVSKISAWNHHLAKSCISLAILGAEDQIFCHLSFLLSGSSGVYPSLCAWACISPDSFSQVRTKLPSSRSLFLALQEILFNYPKTSFKSRFVTTLPFSF